MLSAKPFFVTCIIWLAVATSAIANKKDPDHETQNSITASEFRSQYKVAVAKLKHSYQNVECRAECQYRYHNSKSPSLTRIHDFSAHLLVKDNSTVIVQDYAKDTPWMGTESSLVTCITPNYAFTLSKTKPDNPYLLNLVSRDSTQIERMSLAEDLDIFLFAGNLTFFDPFKVPLEKPTFTILKLERLSPTANEAEELVTLDFTLDDNSSIVKKGHLLFAPNLNWAVLEYHYRSALTDDNYTIYTGKNTFTPLQENGIPILKQGEHKVVDYNQNKKQIVWKYSTTLTDFSIGTVNDSVFQLSHYGLPNTPSAAPTFSIKKPIQWFLIGNGILLFLIIIWVTIKRARTIRTLEGQSEDVI